MIHVLYLIFYLTLTCYAYRLGMSDAETNKIHSDVNIECVAIEKQSYNLGK